MNSVFKSAEGKNKIRAYYNGILSFFPYAQKYAETPFGRTFYLESGSAQSPAVILLHGSCSNSASWLGDIPVLAEHYHVFALDTVGDAGNSSEFRPALSEFPLWLNALTDTLGIQRAVIIGNSLGGWMALHFAAAFPEKVKALGLIASSGIVPVKPSFLAATDTFLGADGADTSLIDTALGHVPKEVRDFMVLVFENFNPLTGELPILTDDQLRALTMPVLFIAGKDDFTMDAQQAASRLESLVPHATIHLIEGSHVIIDTMNTVMPFLKGI